MFHLLDSGAIALVDDEDVADFHDAGFQRLNIVAHSRNQNDDRNIRQLHDIDFVLADADCFHEDRIPRGGVQDTNHVGGCRRESTQMPSCRHASDEDSGVGGKGLHADAIPKDCAAGERAAWIDGNNPNLRAVLPIRGRQPVDERALAGAGASGDSDDARLSRVGKQLPQKVVPCGCAVFDERDGSSQRSRIAIEEVPGLRCHRLKALRTAFSNSRAMTRR